MFFCSFLFGLFFWFIGTRAVLQNITVDDTKPNSVTGAYISYAPADAWDTNLCTNCFVNPEARRFVDETWHQSTFDARETINGHVNTPLTASVAFNGSAVHVFCTLSRSNAFPLVGDSDMTFYLDGAVVGTFVQQAVGSTGFDYTVPVYSNSNIPPGQHTLTVQNGHIDGARSLMILDYITYSYDDGRPADGVSRSKVDASNSSPKPAGPSGTAIAVAAVLSFAVIVLISVLSWFLYRRRRDRGRYGRRLPIGSVQSFPSFVAPRTPVSMPSSFSPPPLQRPPAPPPVYYGSTSAGGQPWPRDQKRRDGGPIVMHRGYADLDPSQARLQRPQMWER